MLTVSSRASKPRVRFSPAGYKKAKKAVEHGDWRKLIRMMQEASIDSHVSGCLIGRRAGFQKSFSVTTDSEAAQDQERARWIESVLKRLDLRDLFKRIHESVLYKYVVIDFEWEVVGGRQLPVDYKRFEQHYFRYNDDGELRIDFGSNDLREIPPEALTCEAKDHPAMLPVLREYILKDFGLESWAAFLETFGEDFILGKYPAGADDGYVESVKEGIDDMGASSRGVVPEGTEVEVKGSSRNTGDHQEFEERANRGISIALLGHANAVENTSGMQVGENLQAYKVRREIAVDDIFYIEACVNDLIETIWRRNFGAGAVPRAEIDKSKPIDTQEWLEVLDTAYRHGIEISPDEYRKLGLSISDDQSPVQRNPNNPLDF